MTAEPRASAPRDLLRKQDWPTLRVKLKGYAWQVTGRRSWERAEDLAQDTIALALKPTGVQWDPEAESAFRFLTGILRGILSNERRLKRTSQEILTGEGDIEAFADPGASSPEAIVIRRQRVERFFDALHARVAEDPLGPTLARCFALGVETPAEQAAETGSSIDDIRRGRRRLQDAAEAIERQRMQTELQ